MTDSVLIKLEGLPLVLVQFGMLLNGETKDRIRRGEYLTLSLLNTKVVFHFLGAAIHRGAGAVWERCEEQSTMIYDRL